MALALDQDGAELFADAADAATLAAVEAALAELPAERAGLRLFGVEGLGALLAPSGRIGALAAAVLGVRTRPVRAILFDKSPTTNWSLAWHQDRVMAVKDRVEVEGFGPWSRKHGALHVAPPFELLAGMLTLRLHLDPVGPGNAPLLIAPGSHRLGRVAEPDIPEAVARCGTYACLAERGDAWLYATPILHASERAAEPRRRRVLQVDFAAHDLPGGLEWLGV
jgi:hypothetical protein